MLATESAPQLQYEGCMHACGVRTAVGEHHLISWAANLDRDSQVILTSDLCTQLQGLVICSHRDYSGHLAAYDLRQRPEAEDRQGGHRRCTASRG